MADSVLDEAYKRLARTGPERDGWLSNHAPMAAEALVRHGRTDAVHRWLDSYSDRLEDAPRGIEPINRDAWRDPLGDPVRAGDWPRIPDQRYGIRALAQLADVPQWLAAAGADPGDPETPADALAEIVDAAVLRFGTHGYGNSVMLVHSATAPNAVLRTLPALPRTLWPGGDPHAIKFVDTAVDTFHRTGDGLVLAVADRCVELIATD